MRRMTAIEQAAGAGTPVWPVVHTLPPRQRPRVRRRRPATPQAAMSRDEAERLLLAQRATIANMVRKRCTAMGCSEQAEDVIQDVWVKLLEGECARVRRFSGRANAKPSTYLFAIVENELMDWARRNWGRAPFPRSVQVQGSAAMDLYLLLVRDQRPFGEAIELALRANPGTNEWQLRGIAASLRPRQLRQPLPLCEAKETPAESSDVASWETLDRLDDLYALLQQIVGALDDRERTLLRKVLQNRGWSGAARALGLSIRQAFSLQQRVKRKATRIMAEHGWSRAQFEMMLHHPAFDPSLVFLHH